MSIKQWFKSLRTTDLPCDNPTSYNSKKFHEEHLDELSKRDNQDDYMVKHMTKYHQECLEEEYVKENKMLRALLKQALVERKTPKAGDIEAQILAFSEACTAWAHQKFIGDYSSSESQKVIRNAWEQEKSKLLFLCYETLNCSEEEVEQKIAEYKREVQDD